MRVLVIEDEPKIAQSVKRGLEQETFSVDVANDGNTGFDLATTEDYDILIIDWMLPGMDGIEISAKLRANKNTTPILFLTAKSEVEDKVKGFQTGVDDYLTKPFAFEELLARIRSLIRRPRNYIGNILECGDLTINTDNYTVCRGSKEINLSKKEFGLLEYLVRNKDKTLSKEQITAHVWDYDADILPNTVEQYIGYLRTKVDRNFSDSKPLIKTVRGFGYTVSCK